MSRSGGSHPAVDVRAVTKEFGGIVALKTISLQIMQGEFFSLLGPSGCGKTTLLRMMGGFETVSSGSIWIDGEEATHQPPYRRKTNMIFQDLALFPHLDVAGNIAFGLQRKRVAKTDIARRVGDALDMVRLQGFETRSIDQLSGGQKQRVAIARALVNDPAVLLLDESLGALDLQLRLQMQSELQRLHRELGSTFIFVTHDQGEAMAMSDRVAVMNGGSIEQVGTTADIYERPRTRFVASFIGHTNLLTGRVVDVRPGRRYRVEVEGLMLSCVSEHDFDPGEMHPVALRFESVLLAPRPADVSGALKATLVDRTYLGSAYRLHLRLESGLGLIADTGLIADARNLQVGGAAWISVAEEAAVIVKE